MEHFWMHYLFIFRWNDALVNWNDTEPILWHYHCVFFFFKSSFFKKRTHINDIIFLILRSVSHWIISVGLDQDCLWTHPAKFCGEKKIPICLFLALLCRCWAVDVNEHVKMYESTENNHNCCWNVKCCHTDLWTSFLLLFTCSSWCWQYNRSCLCVCVHVFASQAAHKGGKWKGKTESHPN